MTPEDLWTAIGLNVERNESLYSLVHPADPMTYAAVASRSTSLAPSPVTSCCPRESSRPSSMTATTRPRSLLLLAQRRRQSQEDGLALTNPHHQPISGLALIDLSPQGPVVAPSSRPTDCSREISKNNTGDESSLAADDAHSGGKAESVVPERLMEHDAHQVERRMLMKDQANYSEKRRPMKERGAERREAPEEGEASHHERERLPRRRIGEREDGEQARGESCVVNVDSLAAAITEEDAIRACQWRDTFQVKNGEVCQNAWRPSPLTDEIAEVNLGLDASQASIGGSIADCVGGRRNTALACEASIAASSQYFRSTNTSSLFPSPSSNARPEGGRVPPDCLSTSARPTASSSTSSSSSSSLRVRRARDAKRCSEKPSLNEEDELNAEFEDASEEVDRDQVLPSHQEETEERLALTSSSAPTRASKLKRQYSVSVPASGGGSESGGQTMTAAATTSTASSAAASPSASSTTSTTSSSSRPLLRVTAMLPDEGRREELRERLEQRLHESAAGGSCPPPCRLPRVLTMAQRHKKGKDGDGVASNMLKQWSMDETKSWFYARSSSLERTKVPIDPGSSAAPQTPGALTPTASRLQTSADRRRRFFQRKNTSSAPASSTDSVDSHSNYSMPTGSASPQEAATSSSASTLSSTAIIGRALEEVMRASTLFSWTGDSCELQDAAAASMAAGPGQPAAAAIKHRTGKRFPPLHLRAAVLKKTINVCFSTLVLNLHFVLAFPLYVGDQRARSAVL